MQFVTDCVDRRNCMECSSSCGCDPNQCQNRAIQNGQRKVLGRHVMEQLTFGTFSKCFLVHFLTLRSWQLCDIFTVSTIHW